MTASTQDLLSAGAVVLPPHDEFAVSDDPSQQNAEHAGESRPDGLQRLLNSATWDAGLVRDDPRAYILERPGDPGAVVIIDETSFRACGRKSAGIGPQHCGPTGQIEHCQVGVFLAYASSKGFASGIDLDKSVIAEGFCRVEKRKRIGASQRTLAWGR